MAVTARMSCNSSVQIGDNRQVQFAPVYSSDPDSPNYSWSKYTPSGSLMLNITNPAAYEQFEVGKTYELTFTPVE